MSRKFIRRVFTAVLLINTLINNVQANTISGLNLFINADTIAKGYVNVSSSVGKLIVEHDGSKYMYNTDGCITIPLQTGNGIYDFSLYEVVYGTKCRLVDEISVYAEMPDENEAFLHPNQYVNYNYEDMQALLPIQIGSNVYKTVCDYVVNNYQYDYAKAKTVRAGTLPNIYGTISERKGICQDLAALTVALLRSYGIPAKLAIGDAGGYYHSWVVTDDYGIFDPTSVITGFKPEYHIADRYY